MSDSAGVIVFVDVATPIEAAVADGVATIAGQRGYIGVGFDGSNYRFCRTNTSGQQVFVGAGTAGSPAGGVLSVQGVSGGQALPVSAASLPLPTGAATEATLATRATEATLATRASEATLATLLTQTTFTTRIPVNGQALMAASIPVVIASDQSALPITDNGGSITIDTTQLPAALIGGRLDTNIGAWLGSTAPTVGQKAMASSVPVTFASDQSPLPVSQSGTWTVQQGTPPWTVRGTDADGAAVTQNPVLAAGWDTTNAQTLLTDTAGRQRVVGAAADGAAVVGDPVQVAGVDGSGNLQAVRTETDGSVRTRDDFIDDRDKLVGVSFAKEAVATTTYYMAIDVSNTTDFHHTAGTAIHLSRSIGKALKTNAGSQWRAQLMVVLRIDGTDADLAILAQTSVNLEDTSTLSVPEQVVDLWPSLANLEVSAGVFTSFLTNAIELNVAAVNTGSAFEDAAGNTPAPAVGDLLIRAQLNSGGGTFSFAFGLEYFVE